MVQQLSFEPSLELTEEMDFYSATDDGRKTYEKIPDRAALEKFVSDSSAYRDLNQVVSNLRPGRVLDVGVAYGVTSAFIATHGHEVTALEPSRRLCEEMVPFVKRLGLPVKVVCGTGECIDQLRETFDAVVFNSSLHHCDGMDRALSNSFQMLRPGGSIFLIEPVLKCYRTKAWFYRTLKTNPEKLGHYGGNEHIYRFGEYVAALEKAGFTSVRSLPSLNYLHHPQRASWDSPARFFVKETYYACLRAFLKTPILPGLLKRLSLLNTVVMAQKPA